MCPHTCKVGPQASFIMENIDADIPCIFFKTFRSPLQDILQRELHIFTRTWLIMLITIKPCLPSIHLNSPWYARWAICIVHVWSAIAYGIWVIQSYAETYLLGILYNCLLTSFLICSHWLTQSQKEADSYYLLLADTLSISPLIGSIY